MPFEIGNILPGSFKTTYADLLDIDHRVEGMEKISYPDEFFDRLASVSVLEHCRAKRVENERTVT